MQGWIKLHRKIRENPIFNNHQLFRLWIICLTEASHKEHTQLIGNQIVELQPGEFVTGRFDLLKLYNDGLKRSDQVSGEKTVYRWLEILEKNEFLTIKKTNKYSIVSITKWDTYQNNDQQMTIKRPTNDQQMTTNKNVKNVKNDKEDIYNNPPISPLKKKEKFAEFVTMTNDEYKKLIVTYGEEFANRCITVLDNYKGAKGKKYKSDYRAILSWVVDRVKEERRNVTHAEFGKRLKDRNNEYDRLSL